MSILQECPLCHRKQSIRNKVCGCGADLDRLKKQREKVKYWISYRLPGGKQKRQSVDTFKELNGFSVEDARKADAKRTVQKAENRIMDIKPDSKMTFRELSNWYLDLESIKSAPSYKVVNIRLNNLNLEIGNKIVSDILPTDLQNYRAKREKQGKADSYIDDEIVAGKTVVNKAFENGKISIDTLRHFKSVKKVLQKGDNARDRVITVGEYNKFYDFAEPHLKGIILAGYWTGLRENDILSLTWDRIDLLNRSIQFTVQHRRTQKPKPAEIYIVDELFEFLTRQNNRLRKVGEDSHVFQYNGKPIKYIIRSVKTACKRAKIKYGKNIAGGFIFYDLRHTSITDMRRAGVDPLVNRKWHGHSLRDAHSGYHTIDSEDLKRAGSQLEKYRRKQRKKAKIRSVDHSVDQVAKNTNSKSVSS